MHQARFLVLLFSLAACRDKPEVRPETGAPPRWRTVHVDHVDPAKLKNFEDARRTWLEALRASGKTDERGFFLQVGGDTFYTLHPFDSFTDLDRLRGARKEAAIKMPEASRAAYDRDSDGALLPPHKTEIWSRNDDLGYPSPGTPLDERGFAVGRMVVLELRPGPVHGDVEYGETWKAVRAALAKARYPLPRVAFESAYGTGKLVTLWLARGRDELAAAPRIKDAVAGVLGEADAAALLRRLDGCAVAMEELEVVRRADLDSP